MNERLGGWRERETTYARAKPFMADFLSFITPNTIIDRSTPSVVSLHRYQSIMMSPKLVIIIYQLVTLEIIVSNNNFKKNNNCGSIF